MYASYEANFPTNFTETFGIVPKVRYTWRTGQLWTTRRSEKRRHTVKGRELLKRAWVVESITFLAWVGQSVALWNGQKWVWCCLWLGVLLIPPASPTKCIVLYLYHLSFLFFKVLSDKANLKGLVRHCKKLTRCWCAFLTQETTASAMNKMPHIAPVSTCWAHDRLATLTLTVLFHASAELVWGLGGRRNR